MFRSGNSIRFTSKEIEESRKIGLDLHGVKSPDGFAHALVPWIEALDEVRPDLLDKLAQEVAKAKGVKLPPRLNVISSSDSPEQS
ncbi:MAG: hypothetical protein V4568_19570 [Pseudomonadota bacterium]